MDQNFPYVLRLNKSRFDVGFKHAPELKGHIAVTDLWAGEVAKQIGRPCVKGENENKAALSRLIQLYGLHATARQATLQGLTTRRVVQSNGDITMVVTGNSL